MPRVAAVHVIVKHGKKLAYTDVDVDHRDQRLYISRDGETLASFDTDDVRHCHCDFNRSRAIAPTKRAPKGPARRRA